MNRWTCYFSSVTLNTSDMVVIPLWTLFQPSCRNVSIPFSERYVFDLFGAGPRGYFSPDVIIHGQVLENSYSSFEPGIVAFFTSRSREKLYPAKFVRT